MKPHFIDRRTRLKISSYKPGLKVLGAKLTLIHNIQPPGGRTCVALALHSLKIEGTALVLWGGTLRFICGAEANFGASDRCNR